MLIPGTIVDGRYEIVSPLGVGGFGMVYRAKHIMLERYVALKMMSPRDMDETAVARFDREAHTLSELKHKNLATFYGYGVWNESPYMVLELINGRSLQVVLTDLGSIPEKRAFHIVKQICEALSCIHANNIIHRDLKPSNVMLTADDTVKLIDFGLVSVHTVSGEQVQKLTEMGSTVGTAQYMSPEQCLGKEVDSRSDIYSLGCILQYCLTGRPPFDADSTVAMMQQHCSDTPPQLETLMLAGTYSPTVQLVLNRALAKEPEERYESAQEMRHDLVQIEQRTTDNLVAANAPVPEGLQFGEKPKSRSAGIIGASIGCLLVVGAGLAFLIPPKPKPPTAHSTTTLGNSKRLLKLAYDSQDEKKRDETIEKFQLALAANESDQALSPPEISKAKQKLAYLLKKQKRYDEGWKIGLEGINDRVDEGDADETLERLCHDTATSASNTDSVPKVQAAIQRADDFYKEKNGHRSLMIMVALAKCSVCMGDKAVTAARIKELEPLVTSDEKLTEDLENIKRFARRRKML